MPPKMFDNHYARLGVPFDATPQEIRRAYHEAAKRLHPDANESTTATDRFLQIQESFDVLSDPARKAAYDQTLAVQDTSPALKVSALFSRKKIIRTPEPQLLYAMLALEPANTEQPETAPPINICLLIDRSTSMQGRRMDMVKLTSQRVLKQLRSGDAISVVTFSDRADVVVEATRESDPAKTNARISLIQPGGGTELYHGLREAQQQIQRFQRTSGINHIMLITDGHTYGDEGKCFELADRFKSSGITVNALGIGTEWNEVFLDRLAGKTGGSSVYAARNSDIQGLIENKFSGLQQIYAENVRMEMTEIDPEVQLRYVFRVQPDPTPLETEGLIALGNVSVHHPMLVICEMLLHKGKQHASTQDIFQAEIRYEIPGREIPTGRTNINLALPLHQSGTPDAPPPELIEAMAKLTLYRMQEQARRDLAAGDFDAATHRLRNLATHILANGDTTLASTILGEVERLESVDRRTQLLEKSIMYGTKSLIARPGM